jgi:hypothetical protein
MLLNTNRLRTFINKKLAKMSPQTCRRRLKTQKSLTNNHELRYTRFMRAIRCHQKANIIRFLI